MRAAQYKENGGLQSVAVAEVAGTEPGSANVFSVMADGPLIVLHERARRAEAHQRDQATVQRSVLPDKPKFPTW